MGVRLDAVPRDAAGLVRVRFGVRARSATAELLAEMYDRWPFFRSVVDNLGMVLAKADLDIGMRYAEALVDRRGRARRGRSVASSPSSS